jgi:hypothetical protein
VKRNHSFHDAMHKRYTAPAWALFYEVGDGTGKYKARSADAIAMSLYPSRGLDLYGHEFKAHRADWIRELKDPDKAESIARFCDFWYVVDTSCDGAVKEEELPANWGLMVWNGQTLRTVKQAPRLKPQALDRIFLSGMLRAARKEVDNAYQNQKDEGWLKHLDIKSYDRGYKTAEEDFNRKWERVRKQSEELDIAIKGFEEKSGIQLSSWNWGNVAKAVYLLQRLSGDNRLSDSIDSAGRQLADQASEISTLASTLREIGELVKRKEQAPA